MNILILLMLISFVLVALACIAFYFSAEHGQFEDLDSPSIRILEDHER